MKFRIRYAEQITGVFILIAIAMSAVVLVYMGINQRWFEQDPVFFSKFKSAEALKVGTSITFKGFQIGQVDSLKLLDDDTVEVRFRIFNKYHSKVKENSVLQLTTYPFGIGGGLLFHPGNNDKGPLPEGSFVPSLDFSLGQEIVKKGLVKTIEKDQLGQYMSSVSDILAQVEGIANQINQETLPLVNGILEGKDPGPIGAALANVEAVSGEALAMTRDLSLKTSAILSNIQELSSNLNKNLSDPAAMVKSFIAEDGSIGMMLDDQGLLFKRIDDILIGINGTLNEINSFAGYLNETTPELSGLLEESRKALSESKDVLEGIKNNPLIRGGISGKKEQPTTFQSYRDEDF